MSIILEAETRTVLGKGASRRLRRLENKVPAVIYGGSKKAESIHLLHNKVLKAMESESIYSSVFDLKVDGKAQRVILKDVQRHPYKPIVLHMDFQRVSAHDILVKFVPLHFINDESAKGVKAGGVLNHVLNQVEVRCEAQHLPAFIEVDVANLDVDDVLHLSQLSLPKGVELATDISEEGQDGPVVSIHLPRAAIEEEAAGDEEAEEGKAEPAADDNTESSAE